MWSAVPMQNRPRKYHVPKSMATEMGKANKNHDAKLISGASGNLISKILTNTMFGGVPTSVAMPPIDAP